MVLFTKIKNLDVGTGAPQQRQEILVLQTTSNLKPAYVFFKDFACVLQMILFTKIKNLDVGTGAPQQRQEVY